MNKSVNISRGFLNSTFPFFLKIDRKGIIRDAGKSLLGLLPEMIGREIQEYLTIKRPLHLNPEYEQLQQHVEKLVFCELKLNTGTVFYKGQIINFEDEKRLCFLGTLFLNDPDDLLKHKIALNDFSISDSSADLLQVLQVNKMVNSDLEKMNRILAEKEKKYSEIIEHANEIIFTTDINGQFNYMNEIGMNFLQLQYKDISQYNFSDLTKEEHLNSITEIGQKLLTREIEVGYVEFQLKQSNKWIGQNITLYSKDGRDGFQGIGRDITEKKKYEKIILQESKKAKEAAESKSRFLANMSHEIRTPLNGIMGLTELMIKGNLEPKQQKYLEAIQASSETLMVVINDILDISKIESGKMEIKTKPFNIRLCITQMMELMEVKAAEKNIQLISEIEHSIPENLLGDEARLNQMLFNVVGNAIKFTKEGKVEIKTSLLEKATDDIAHIEIKVKDSGIGIPHEKIQDIFEAFQQVGDSVNTTQKGTGLGLNITKKLVELMEGEISVESTYQEGSCFSLKIPFEIVYNTQKLEESKFLNKSKVDFSQVKILLAEDNPINQMVTIDILKEYQVEVDLAENGQEAVIMMDKNQYDIILMDMQMPVLNGYEAMQKIRAKYSTEKVRMMALTAHVNEGEIQKCKSFGADDYLSKPYNPDDLFRKLTELSIIKKQPSKKEKNGVKQQETLKNELLDLENFNLFTGGAERVKKATLELLIQELPRDIKNLREQVREKNLERIGALAHKTKPNFKLILKEQFSQPIANIERLAKTGKDLNEINNELIKMEGIIIQLIEALKTELK